MFKKEAWRSWGVVQNSDRENEEHSGIVVAANADKLAKKHADFITFNLLIVLKFYVYLKNQMIF